MSVEKHVAVASGHKIKVSMIKCGGDGQKDAYKYLARLAIKSTKRS